VVANYTRTVFGDVHNRSSLNNDFVTSDKNDIICDI
jgi:hypothetical protein